MKRKKTPPTRRRRALRWLTALCTVLLVNSWLHLYSMTPWGALQKLERTYGLAPMKIWKIISTPRAVEPDRQRWMLTYYEDGVLLSSLSFQPRTGWQLVPEALTRDRGGALTVGTGGYCNATEEGGYETKYLFFGRISDPQISAVEASVYHSSLSETVNGIELLDSPEQQSRGTADEWKHTEQGRLFLLELPLVEDPGGSTSAYYTVTALREDGTSVSVSAENIATGIERYTVG